VRPTLRELANDNASLMIAHASGYNTAAAEIGAETKVPLQSSTSPRRASPEWSPTMQSAATRALIWLILPPDDETGTVRLLFRHV
jgi:hypothetical protein